MMETIKAGDVFCFTTEWDKKHQRYSFVGWEDSGKIIISEKMLPSGGFFKIEKVLKTADNYSIVRLGERVTADDLYPDIGLEEAKKVLKNHDFEIYEKKVSFNDGEEDRQEVQLLGWHKKYNIWINGTTWQNKEFNHLFIVAPNYNKTYRDYFSSQFSTSSEEIVMNVVQGRPNEKILTYLCNLAKNSKNPKIVMKYSRDGETAYSHFSSYLSTYLFSDTFDGRQQYAREVYKELPKNGKEFVVYNS